MLYIDRWHIKNYSFKTLIYIAYFSVLFYFNQVIFFLKKNQVKFITPFFLVGLVNTFYYYLIEF